MNFGPHHYMPILKIKRGEKAALEQIAVALRARITPLLEVVERKPDKSVAAHLETAFDNLADSVSTYPRCFIDVRELAADGPEAAVEAFALASASGMNFTPVTGLSRGADVGAALSHPDNGVALRLTRPEFEASGLPQRVVAFLAQHQLTPEEVDLIIDLGAAEDLIVDGVGALAAAFMADTPHQERWRTFTISACTFPVSMGGVERHSHDLAERADWLAWRDHLHARRGQITRLPAYGDSAIQHPSGVKGFDPRIMQVSASIRYALAEQWLLVKGESTRSKPPSIQFPELATRLVYGHLRKHFAGAGHCAGCASMKAAADGAPKHGSAEAWRRFGTIHHIATVMQELDSLPWP